MRLHYCEIFLVSQYDDKHTLLIVLFLPIHKKYYDHLTFIT